MSKIITPTNQKVLTNVAVVRYKRAGLRFEIACYKNTVLSWRKKIETDLDEVLQSRAIFENVSKGRLSKKEELQKAFPDLKEEEIILEILNKGELQISEKERQAAQEETLKGVATLVAEICVNPSTKRPYTVSMIEKGMKDIHFGIKPRQNIKQAANELILGLKKSGKFPIEKAEMCLQLVFPSHDYAGVKGRLKTYLKEIQEEREEDGKMVILCKADPGFYRQIEETVVEGTKGKGSFQIESLLERKEGDEDIASFDGKAYFKHQTSAGGDAGSDVESEEGKGKKKGGKKKLKKEVEEESVLKEESDDEEDWASSKKKGKKGKKKKHPVKDRHEKEERIHSEEKEKVKSTHGKEGGDSDSGEEEDEAREMKKKVKPRHGKKGGESDSGEEEEGEDKDSKKKEKPKQGKKGGHSDAEEQKTKKKQPDFSDEEEDGGKRRQKGKKKK